ncbi:hypothetical protein ACFWZK_23035 [[Kitasatospora] papulosa]|uniref:hypothetical protein n=1 Tax=Streptomyces TaxID=1883 RepID=UPI00332531EA
MQRLLRDPYISREKAQWQEPAVFPQTVQRLVLAMLDRAFPPQESKRPLEML